MAIPRNYMEFIETLSFQYPLPTWSKALQAMWFDAKGDWEKSHSIAQDIHDQHGNMIHAYLHRKEGDTLNSAYWYRLAHKKFPSMSLEEEQRELIIYFLSI